MLDKCLDEIAIAACVVVAKSHQEGCVDAIDSLCNQHFFCCLTKVEHKIGILPDIFCCIDLGCCALRRIERARVARLDKRCCQKGGILCGQKKEVKMVVETTRKGGWNLVGIGLVLIK